MASKTSKGKGITPEELMRRALANQVEKVSCTSQSTNYILVGYFDKSEYPARIFSKRQLLNLKLDESNLEKFDLEVKFKTSRPQEDDVPSGAFLLNGVQCKLVFLGEDMLCLVTDYMNKSPAGSSPLMEKGIIFNKDGEDLYKNTEINSRFLYWVGFYEKSLQGLEKRQIHRLSREKEVKRISEYFEKGTIIYPDAVAQACQTILEKI